MRSVNHEVDTLNESWYLDRSMYGNNFICNKMIKSATLIQQAKVREEKAMAAKKARSRRSRVREREMINSLLP